MVRPASLQEEVRRRAGYVCEYCRLPATLLPTRFHIDHIVSPQHGGSSALDNLALACERCNAFKGPNLSAVDRITGAVVPIFNPRQDSWHDHFRRFGSLVDGITATGRATVQLLNMNSPGRVAARTGLIATGQLLPNDPAI